MGHIFLYNISEEHKAIHACCFLSNFFFSSLVSFSFTAKSLNSYFKLIQLFRPDPAEATKEMECVSSYLLLSKILICCLSRHLALIK